MTIQLRRKRIRWYWRIVASNGQVLAHSETYFSKASALRTARGLAGATGWELRA